MTLVLGLAEGKQPWFWGFAGATALTLLLLNVLVLVAVHVRRLRQHTRGRRASRFRTQVADVFAQLDTETRARDPQWLRERLSHFDELERPLAAVMLIERLKPATPEEREHT